MDLILTHYKYDDENIPLFDSKLDLYQYFINKADKEIVEDINFNAEDLLSTTQVVEIESSLSLFKILNFNYCIVDNGKIDETLYFKIDKSSQEDGGLVRLELSIDAWNTYGYDLLASQPQALIRKAHLNRFDFEHLDPNGPHAPFDYKKNSPLFEREDLQNLALRTTDKTKLKFIIDTSAEDSQFNNFIHENIVCWKYYFLSSNLTYKYRDFAGNPQETGLSSMAYYKGNLSTEDSNFVVICSPIYKNENSKKIYVNLNNSVKLWNDNACLNFILGQDNAFACVKAIKFSFIPPFAITNLTGRYTIDNNGDMQWLRDDNPLNGFRCPMTGMTLCFGLRTRQDIDDKILLTSKEFKPKYHDFDDSELSKEPKLYNEDYSTYKIFFAGQQYYLPVSKTSFTPKFYYHEIITADITKGMLCYATSKETIFGNTENNVFAEHTESDFTGFAFSFDMGLWIPEDVLDNYLASNKNYLQIIANNNNTAEINSFLRGTGGVIGGAVAGGTMGAMAGPIGALAGAVLGASGAIINQATTAISNDNTMKNAQLTLDNMRNAPQSVSNLNSNPLLAFSIGEELGLFIELQEALEHEQKMLVDLFNKFGYNYNRLGNINDFIKTRKSFNYIQAELNDVEIDVSMSIKNILKNMFARGIRFWHNKQVAIKFDYNNYEKEWETI